MARHQRLENDLYQSTSFWTDQAGNDAFDRDPCYSCSLEDGRVRIVWVTNYTNDEEFPIHVPIEDRLDQIFASPFVHGDSFRSFHAHDLSKLDLNELLLLLYRLQQCTHEPSHPSSPCYSARLSQLEDRRSPPLYSFNPIFPHAVHSSISRRQSSFTLSNMADAPQQLTTTLIHPSIHVPRNTSIHSPNDVVTKLLQSFHLTRHEHHAKSLEHKVRPRSLAMPHCSYHASQQHKARLVSNLLAVNSTRR